MKDILFFFYTYLFKILLSFSFIYFMVKYFTFNLFTAIIMIFVVGLIISFPFYDKKRQKPKHLKRKKTK